MTFGLAVSPVEEDREAVALNMQSYPQDIQAKALEIADAAEDLVASGMTQGFERFEQLRQRYQQEPWFKHVRGNFTYLLLSLAPAELREKRQMFVLGTPMHYDSVPVIASVQAPQLWILAQDDIDAPSAETARRLERLRASGRPITTVMFPRTEHGIFEYETQPDGTRLSTRQRCRPVATADSRAAPRNCSSLPSHAVAPRCTLLRLPLDRWRGSEA